MISEKNTTRTELRTDKRGNVVRVVVHGGEIVERMIWECDDEEGVIYLCSKETFVKLSTGNSDVRPVGFPMNSVVGGIQ